MTRARRSGQRIHEILASRRQIAVVWCIEDVQLVRPDLDQFQCWEVLKMMKRQHDANVGINWDSLESVASMLYGYPDEET